jgi:hypothetical protein
MSGSFVAGFVALCSSGFHVLSDELSLWFHVGKGMTQFPRGQILHLPPCGKTGIRSDTSPRKRPPEAKWRKNQGHSAYCTCRGGSSRRAGKGAEDEIMTKDQIEQMLGEMGIPFRYHHFTQKEMQDIPLPIVVWITPGTDNFFADGKTYKKITKLDIELYTDDKDWELEKKLEEILDKHDIAWEQTASEWLESEKMWESLYEMEV